MRKLIFPQTGSSELQVQVLRAICGPTEDKTLIDLCCGSAPQTSQLKFKLKTYVDAVDRVIPDGKVIVANVLDYLKSGTMYYDISISTDTIEHFRDKDAKVFVDRTSRVAKKNIWFTPLGEFCMTFDPENNDPDTHKSEWTPEKLEELYPDRWSYLVFPNWHPTLRNSKNEVLGAFFFWNGDDFGRVKNELKNLG